MKMTVPSQHDDNNNDNKLGVVLIGSSGGGRATLGNEQSPLELFECFENELYRIHATIDYALFVHCDVGLDGITTTTTTEEEETTTIMATLYTIGFKEQEQQWRGTLKEVNKRCEELDRTILSNVILDTTNNNRIGGLISISCHAERIHKHSLQAAATRQIPVTGSGGTSLSYACSNYGIHLVGNAGGSVATTTYTKAVSYTHALANAHLRPYPYHNNNKKTPTITIASFVSILNTCLPSFLAVCLVNTFVASFFTISTRDNKPYSSYNDPFVWLLQNQALPTVCAVVTATTLAPHHQSSVIMASSIASMASSSSILSGMFAGYIISILIGRCLFFSIRYNIPATMTNILVAGVLGIFVAIGIRVTYITNLFHHVTEVIRWCIQQKLFRLFPGIGSILGCIFCYGSKVGWYHTIFLPIILIEMEHGQPSLLGSIDQCTLVMTSAGICAANIISGGCETNDNEMKKKTSILCTRGILINLFCGDFIEVAYPFMERSSIVNVFAYIGCSISSEILCQHVVLSSAYVPFFLTFPLAGDKWFPMFVASILSFTLSMTGMLLHNRFGIPPNLHSNKNSNSKVE